WLNLGAAGEVRDVQLEYAKPQRIGAEINLHALAKRNGLAARVRDGRSIASIALYGPADRTQAQDVVRVEVIVVDDFGVVREAFPPNFLMGDAAQIASNLRQCAPRMLVRLSAWHTAKDQRIKSPMPPATAVQALGMTTGSWAAGAELEVLRSYIEALSRAQG